MISSPDALGPIVRFFETHRVPYMVVGGLANAVWGEVRATRDADFKVVVDGSIEDFRHTLLAQFPARPMGIPAEAASPLVLHVWGPQDTAIDVLISVLDYERQAVARAKTMKLAGMSLRVCTAEDLVIHKAVANRDQDWIDIRGILRRQSGKLDHGYIEKWLREFAQGLEAPEILRRYESLLPKQGEA